MIQAAPISSYENDPQTKAAVDQLQELLRWLYPTPDPDVFTLDDFRYRYRLTGLGELATIEIEQSQRVSRAIGDFDQIGLCEFHVGLIYFYWGDYHGAIQPFVIARRQWAFVHKPASECLARFAEGMAQFLAFHYESAVRSFSRAQKLIDRIRLAPAEFDQEELIRRLSHYLQAAQDSLRHVMWPAPLSSEPRPSAEDEAAPAQETAAQETAAPQTAVAVSNADAQPVEDSPDAIMSEESTPGTVPLPRTNLPPISEPLMGTPLPVPPVPGHHLDSAYGWYEVADRYPDDFYTYVQPGDWVLVYTQPEGNDRFDQDQPVLVVLDNEIEGTILMKPTATEQPYQRIYLAQWIEPGGTFRRDMETGKVTFSSKMEIAVDLSAILGVVVGLWRPIPRAS